MKCIIVHEFLILTTHVLDNYVQQLVRLNQAFYNVTVVVNQLILDIAIFFSLELSFLSANRPTVFKIFVY